MVICVWRAWQERLVIPIGPSVSLRQQQTSSGNRLLMLPGKTALSLAADLVASAICAWGTDPGRASVKGEELIVLLRMIPVLRNLKVLRSAIPVPVLRSLKGCKLMFVLHWQGLACKLTLLYLVPSCQWTYSFFWSFHNSQIMCSICVSPKSQNPRACPEHRVLWVVQGEPWIEMDRYGIVCFLGVWTWRCAPFWFTDKMLEFVSGYQEPRRLYQQPATWDWQTWRMKRHSHAHVDNWIRQEHHLQHYWCCRSWPAV